MNTNTNIITNTSDTEKATLTDLNTTNTTYVAQYFKADLEALKLDDYFNGYQELPKTVVSLRRQINKMAKELAEVQAKLSVEINKQYGAGFTPANMIPVVAYTSKDGISSYFDLISGSPITADNLLENGKFLNVSNKKGYVRTIAGYDFQHASVIGRKYAISINASCSQMTTKVVEEVVIPILDKQDKWEVVLNTRIKDFDKTERGKNDWLYVSEFDTVQYLDKYPAKEFINYFWGIEGDFKDISLADLRKAMKTNKAAEVILRTAPESIMKTLLATTYSKSAPVHNLLGFNKKDYDVLTESGMITDYLKLSNNINNYLAKEEAAIITKTPVEWVEYLGKEKQWKEDLSFYNIRCEGESPLWMLIKYYVGYHRGWGSVRNSKIWKYYKFGKFCQYAIEETINQGYSNLEKFCTELVDYINQCEDLGINPTLYSSYLSQTHALTSRNYNIHLDEIQKKQFNDAYAGYRKYTSHNGEYTIIRPKDADDVKREGSEQNHCVGSYINRVLKGECLILFLRKVDDIDTPVITIELSQDRISQARGHNNRDLTPVEMNILTEFAASRHYKIAKTVHIDER